MDEHGHPVCPHACERVNSLVPAWGGRTGTETGTVGTRYHSYHVGRVLDLLWHWWTPHPLPGRPSVGGRLEGGRGETPGRMPPKGCEG